ncbi:MAG: serine/threonine-protein phosphatase [Betaproteobacteria bacterium]|nr:serine/threonine-protein phosphatase [Betaproteobacteria bacterium]
MRFTIFQDSHIGGRKVNQDRLAYSYSKDVLMMAIADGMGGHARGEIAAEVAVNTLTHRFQQEAARGTLKRPMEFLESSIQAAHRAIVAFADQNDMLECPRTTIVVCIVQNGTARWAHSGDSRLYIFRDGRLGTSTLDHSRVQQMIDAGLITQEQASVHPDRNKIYNCLGGVLPPMVTISEEWRLKVGDSILLSTDGFWGQVNSDFIASQLHREDIVSLVPKLMEAAERKAGNESDNLSVIGLTWVDQDDEEAPGTVTTTEPIQGFTTSSMNTQEMLAFKDDISDAEIERAITEIQNAIKKVGK